MRTDTICLILHAVYEETRVFSRVISRARSFSWEKCSRTSFWTGRCR